MPPLRIQKMTYLVSANIPNVLPWIPFPRNISLILLKQYYEAVWASIFILLHCTFLICSVSTVLFVCGFNPLYFLFMSVFLKYAILKKQKHPEGCTAPSHIIYLTYPSHFLHMLHLCTWMISLPSLSENKTKSKYLLMSDLML